jgi:hypothetical protein
MSRTRVVIPEGCDLRPVPVRLPFCRQHAKDGAGHTCARLLFPSRERALVWCLSAIGHTNRLISRNNSKSSHIIRSGGQRTTHPIPSHPSHAFSSCHASKGLSSVVYRRLLILPRERDETRPSNRFSDMVLRYANIRRVAQILRLSPRIGRRDNT